MPTGLTFTQQPPLSTDATTTADAPASELWHRLATDGLADRIEEGVMGLVGDVPAGARGLALEDAGVTAMDGLFASALARLADANPVRDDWQDGARRAIREFGAAEGSALGLPSSLNDVADGPLAVLRAGDVVPTVAVRIGDGFDALRADQRRDVVRLLAALADVCDLRVVASGFVQTKLRRRWHEVLPVSAPCNGSRASGEVAARVERARDALDPDGRETAILRQLAAGTSEALSYHSLHAGSSVSESRVRQCAGRLASLELVGTFDGVDGRTVELLAAGRGYLDVLESEIGVQRSIFESVSETGNRSDDSRVTPPAREGRPRPGGEAEAATESAPDRPLHHQVRTAARHRAAAAAGCAVEGGVAVADHPIPAKDNPHDPHWYYDHDADRLEAGCEYRNPMQGWVCIALALADQRTFRHVLTSDRFEAGKLGDMLANHTDLLRSTRCLGYLADADATPEGYRDALLGAAEHLRELTKRWHHGDFDCSPERFRGVILREAHGLAGTITHLLDLADIDLVREFRIPEFSRDFDTERRADLAETIAVGASIGSRYGEFAAHRQLFESRPDKRSSTFAPTIDAADPFGDLIGSFVVVGEGIDAGFADRLRRRLDSRQTHDDAPEFAVRVPVETANERRHTAQTVVTMCRHKHIRTTRSAVSLFAALTGTPYDAAAALGNLAPESKAPGRRARLDEVRFALSTLPADRLLTDMSKPALSKLAKALLATDERLTQTALAEAAGVSTRSVRTHIETLEAFGLVRQTTDGYRFALSFRDSERGEDIAPWFVATDDDAPPETRDVLADALAELLDPSRYADPGDPVASALFAGPGEVIPALRDAAEWLNPWVQAVEVLLDREATDPPRTATVGVEPSQTAVAAQGAAG